ncbi:hypothetical protein [Sphaerimonospora thailandensis]|uniref:Ribbon-helix-helix CopG family protein n=1 Tax=Sphaerimonospora thailandensis TaxID=795644 RepID=A0A8J3W0U1_9ACTN|nr:hypothetical protein [Sphaerimonospora thailandensis]GIH71448.1 hypothetical protein Mth01_37010 [Sphaerimonospora thailandensis]
MMTIHLTHELTRALYRRAEIEGRSVPEIVVTAIGEYLARADGDEEVHQLAVEASHRWQSLLNRLAQ